MSIDELLEQGACNPCKIFGKCTGRLVAKFSHEAEARHYVKMINEILKSVQVDDQSWLR